jgi:hypothetical protein
VKISRNTRALQEPLPAYSVEKLHARSWPEIAKALEWPQFE